MYIDTHSKMTMENSLCLLLNIAHQDLLEFLKKIDMFNFDELVDEFIDEHITDEKKIDKVLFFHLSRRLNSAESVLCSLPLIELLTTENEFSNFLLKHDVTFEYIDDQLEIFYHGKHKSLNKNHGACCGYLKKRLGHLRGHEDFCVNGFAFKDLLYKHRFTKYFSDVPEFVKQLAQFLGNDRIGFDYYDNSEYYCIEYLVPIEKIIFDEIGICDLEENQIYLLRKVFKWVYEYEFFDGNTPNPENNPILRLEDKDIMLDDYYQTKELITENMIEY